MLSKFVIKYLNLIDEILKQPYNNIRAVLFLIIIFISSYDKTKGSDSNAILFIFKKISCRC